MKKKLIVIISLVLTMCFMTGCDKPGKKQEEKAETETTEEIGAPYIGYAPLDRDTADIIKAMSQAISDSNDTEILKYAAGENNLAIIRFEKSNMDGVWETYKEEKLLLTHNANTGYMVFTGDTTSGVSINTGKIELDDGSEKSNSVQFGKLYNKDAESMYPVTEMFGKGRESLSEKERMQTEDRIDLSEKKAIQINFEKDKVYEKNEKPEIGNGSGGKVTDINDIYENRDGKYDSIFSSQKMLAVTIEFEEDEMLYMTPYACDMSLANTKEKGDIYYDAGEYDFAEICLEKVTENGEWKTVDKKVIDCTDFPQGTLTFSGKIGEKLNVRQSGGETVSFSVPKKKDTKVTAYEKWGLLESEGYAGAKNKIVIYMAEQKIKDKDSIEGLEDTSKTLTDAVKEGIALEDIYRNKNGDFEDMYANAMYAVTLKFTNQND